MEQVGGLEEEDEDGGVRVTGMRYTINLTVNMYSHVDRFLKKINRLRMLSHCLKHGECVFHLSLSEVCHE